MIGRIKKLNSLYHLQDFMKILDGFTETSHFLNLMYPKEKQDKQINSFMKQELK